VGKRKKFHRIKSSISNKYRLSHAGGPARRTASCALCCTHKWTLSVTKYRWLSDETSTVARSCQVSSTDDGHQFITPNFHLCRTKLATCCDDRRAAANFFLCPKSGIKLNLLPFLENTHFLITQCRTGRRSFHFNSQLDRQAVVTK